MRRVACYTARSSIKPTESAAEVFAAVRAEVESWLKVRGLEALAPGQASFKLFGKREGRIQVQEYATDTELECEVTFEETVSQDIQFLTRIVFATEAGAIHLFIELRAGAKNHLLSPTSLDVRCPELLRTLLNSRIWQVGHTPVQIEPFQWPSQRGARQFLKILEHPDRNLPLIVVSEHDGACITPTLSHDLARDVCGLSIVAHIDEAASAAITKIRGRPWSCYDGAIRVYWPLGTKTPNASKHPVWTRAKIIDAADNPRAAAALIRTVLRKRLLELSTYSNDEPKVLENIREKAARQKFETALEQAKDADDQRKLAEEYFNECARLETELTRHREQVADLEGKVENLSEALRYSFSQDSTELAPEQTSEIEDVQSAIERARTEFSEYLTFGDDIEDAVANLHPEAGPPDKIYAYLEALADMAVARKQGPLGKSIFDWLEDKGVYGSYESEIVMKSRGEAKKRIWHDGSGRREFNAHLKPNESTGPDKCVRIYFDADDRTEKIVVAYIGRHP